MPGEGHKGYIMVVCSKSYLLLFSHSVMPDPLWPHQVQHTRLPCPSPSPRACSNSHPLSRWFYLTISSSAALFTFCLQSFPASGSFAMCQLFASGGQSSGTSASASVLPMNILGWFPLGLTGLILQSKGLSKVFSSTTIKKHQYNRIILYYIYIIHILHYICIIIHRYYICVYILIGRKDHFQLGKSRKASWRR